MCGQLSKDSGIIICGHNNDKDINVVKRNLVVVFQNSILDKELTVKDNLQSRAAINGIYGKEFKKRLLDFKDSINRVVGKLSVGQRRRIDIARALIQNQRF